MKVIRCFLDKIRGKEKTLMISFIFLLKKRKVFYFSPGCMVFVLTITSFYFLEKRSDFARKSSS